MAPAISFKALVEGSQMMMPTPVSGEHISCEGSRGGCEG